MRETHDVVGADADRASRGGLVEHPFDGGGSAECLREQQPRRALDGRDKLEQRSRAVRERADPIPDELLERRGDRQPRSQVRVLPLDGPRELEREHRIPPGGGVDVGELCPRDPDVEPQTHEVLQRAHAERPERDVGEGARLECVREAERFSLVVSSAQRREDADRRLARAPCREGEHARRRGVEPLDVVDGHEQRAFGREDAERRDEGARQRKPVRISLRIGRDPEYGGERTTLRLRQHVRDVLERRIEEVRDRSERDRHLGLGAPRDQHADTVSLGGSHGLAQQRGLPDPRLAANDDSAGMLSKALDELAQPCELLVPPDEFEARGRHTASVTHDTKPFYGGTLEL